MPRQNYTEFSSLLRSVQYLGEKFDELPKYKTEITEIPTVATNQHEVIAIKGEKIEELESRIDDLEQYSCRDNIITGLTTHHKTWARRASPIELRNEGEHAPEL